MDLVKRCQALIAPVSILLPKGGCANQKRRTLLKKKKKYYYLSENFLQEASREVFHMNGAVKKSLK